MRINNARDGGLLIFTLNLCYVDSSNVYSICILVNGVWDVSNMSGWDIQKPYVIIKLHQVTMHKTPTCMKCPILPCKHNFTLENKTSILRNRNIFPRPCGPWTCDLMNHRVSYLTPIPEPT